MRYRGFTVELARWDDRFTVGDVLRVMLWSLALVALFSVGVLAWKCQPPEKHVFHHRTSEDVKTTNDF